MNPTFLAAALLGAALYFGGCAAEQPTDTRRVTLEQGPAAQAVVIGEKMAPLTLADQFGKERTVDENAKTVLFVFSKAMGGMVHDYLAARPADYLQQRHMEVVADISRMPSLITEYVAMPGFREYGYPMMLIFDEAAAAPYKNEAQRDKVMVVSLENLTVKGVTFVATPEDLKAAVD